MTPVREALPFRRSSVSFDLERAGLRYTAASWFSDGRLGEIFVGSHEADSHADACAKDSAILASLCLQFGVPLDVVRKALLRDSRGQPSTPIGCALDRLAEEMAPPAATTKTNSEICAPPGAEVAHSDSPRCGVNDPAATTAGSQFVGPI
jgi:hypothetical protein